MAGRVENLLLDIGNVLVDVEAGRGVAALRALPGGDAAKLGGWVFDDPDKDAFEAGDLSPREFFERFRAKSGLEVTFDLFAEIYSDIWRAKREVLDYLRALKRARSLRVYLLSNTDPLHVPRVFERCPELDFHDGWVASYQIRARKPAPEFYARALARVGAAPEACVFVDDLAENVTGARAAGLDAVQFTGLDALRRELEARLGRGE